jgi:hypothetical protein
MVSPSCAGQRCTRFTTSSLDGVSTSQLSWGLFECAGMLTQVYFGQAMGCACLFVGDTEEQIP